MAHEDFLQEEMNGAVQEGQEFDGQGPTQDEAADEAKDDRVWKLEDGTEVSKSEFIREQFTKFNLSRKEISEKFDINYRTVYGATVNMVNDAEPSKSGRSASNAKINVTADGKVVTVVEGVTHVDNVAVSDEDAEALGETTEVDRNTWISEQVAGGRSRGDVAAALGLSYGVVYSLTKDAEGSKQRHEIEYNGEVISRSEYIRRRFDEGVSRADIAKELGVDYPVVWSALKSLKSEGDKFAEAIDKVAKFADKVDNAEDFNILIEQLRGITLKQEEEATEETVEETTVDSDVE